MGETLTAAEYKHRWYLANRERCLAKTRERYETHKDEIRVFQRQWYLKNKDRVQINHKAWRKRNVKKLREYEQNYKKLNLERIRKQQHQWYLKNKSKNREWKKRNPEKVIKNANRQRIKLNDGYVRYVLKRLGYTDIGGEMIETARFIFRLNRIRRETCKKHPSLKGYWKRGRLRRLER